MHGCAARYSLRPAHAALGGFQRGYAADIGIGFWPGQSAAGKRVRFDVQPDSPWLEVNGVVQATRDGSLDMAPGPTVYMPMEPGAPFMQQFLAHRTAVGASSFARPLRAAVARVDPRQSVFLVTSMQALRNNSAARRRFSVVTLGRLAC